MERIDIGDYLVIAELHTGIDATTLARMPSLVALAQAALAAPFAGFGDFEAFPLFYEKAAIYCARVVTYHALPDGNKRTGYDVMREFIARNGRSFAHPPAGLDETATVIENLAGGTLSEADFTAWMRDRIDKPE